MTLRLNGSTSGYTELDAPATGGNNTLVLPTGNGTADQALVTNGSGTLSFADRGRMVLATAQNSTSGTFVDFTGIPSWVKRVTVMFDGVSTNGTSNPLIQLGTSAGVSATGYASYGVRMGTSAVTGGAAYTAGFGIASNAATTVLRGNVVISGMGSNTWTAQGFFSDTPNANGLPVGGSVTLSGTLDRIRITTVNGTDTFDAGSINILYEG